VDVIICKSTRAGEKNLVHEFYPPKACLVWKEHGSCEEIAMKLSEESDSLSSVLDARVPSASGTWLFPWSILADADADADATIICHLVAIDTIP
jgi:hypothetical protein